MTKLDLYDNQLCDDGLKAIASCLASNATLRVINLKWNGFGKLNQVRAVQVDPRLAAPGFLCLELKYDEPVSIFTLNYNLCCYKQIGGPANDAGILVFAAALKKNSSVRPARYCPPRHPTHFDLLVLELNDTI